MKENTCCFFGHRTINETDELRTKLTDAIEKLIIDEKVDTFLFGSKSAFDRLCLELVTKLKEKYPHVKKHSKDFGGTLNDPDVIKLCGCSGNSYCKYKRLLKEKRQS